MQTRVHFHPDKMHTQSRLIYTVFREMHTVMQTRLHSGFAHVNIFWFASMQNVFQTFLVGTTWMASK
jgi:hypothetical protein